MDLCTGVGREVVVYHYEAVNIGNPDFERSGSSGSAKDGPTEEFELSARGKDENSGARLEVNGIGIDADLRLPSSVRDVGEVNIRGADLAIRTRSVVRADQSIRGIVGLERAVE